MKPRKPLFWLTLVLPSLLLFIMAAVVKGGRATDDVLAAFLVAIGIAFMIEECVRWKYIVKRRDNTNDRT